MFVEQWSRDSCLGRLTWGIFNSPSSISPREEATRPPLSGRPHQQTFLMWRSCTEIQTLSYFLVRWICESTQGKKLEKIPFYFILFILCLRPDLPEKCSFRVFLQRKCATTSLPDENEDKSIREEHRSVVFLFFVFFLHGSCLAYMTCPLQKKTKKNDKSASASPADAGGRSLPVAIAGLHHVKVFPLPADALCCEKGGAGGGGSSKIMKSMKEAAALQSSSSRLDAWGMHSASAWRKSSRNALHCQWESSVDVAQKTVPQSFIIWASTGRADLGTICWRQKLAFENHRPKTAWSQRLWWRARLWMPLKMQNGNVNVYF